MLVRAAVFDVSEDDLFHRLGFDWHRFGGRGVRIPANCNLSPPAVVLVPGVLQVGLGHEIHAEGPPFPLPIDPGPLVVGGFALSVDIPVDSGLDLFVTAFLFCFLGIGLLDC